VFEIICKIILEVILFCKNCWYLEIVKSPVNILIIIIWLP